MTRKPPDQSTHLTLDLLLYTPPFCAMILLVVALYATPQSTGFERWCSEYCWGFMMLAWLFNLLGRGIVYLVFRR